MTKTQQMVKVFMEKVGQKCPDKPIIPDLDTRKLRAKLILEEALELINKGLGLEAYEDRWKVTINIGDIKFNESLYYKPDLVELADGIGDLDYVNTGTAIACGIDMDPVLDEIQDSNMSKLIDGYTDESGKFRKGKSFRPPDIKSIIEKQSK